MKKFYCIILIWIMISYGYAETILPSIISSNTTLTKANSPYIVESGHVISREFNFGDENQTLILGEGVIVNNSATLTIEPGVVVLLKKKSGDTYAVSIALDSGANIKAEGTSNDTIVFTSYNDPVYGLGANSAASGDWGGIAIIGEQPISDTISFKNCLFRYGMRYFQIGDFDHDPVIQYSLNAYIMVLFSGNISVQNCFFEKGGDGQNISANGNVYFDIQNNYIDSGVAGVNLDSMGEDSPKPYGIIKNNNITVRGIDKEDTSRSIAVDLAYIGETGVIFENNILNSEDGIPALVTFPIPVNLQTNTFSGAYINCVGLRGNWDDSGSIASETIPALNIPYLVMDNLYFSSNTVISIEPGAIFKFDTGGLIGSYNDTPSPSGIYIDGNAQLIAKGTADSLIVFTSIHNDNYGGNSDIGIDYSAKPGDWNQISFSTQNSITQIFEYCIVSYAGAEPPWSGNNEIPAISSYWNSDFSIKNSVLEYNNYGAIGINNSNVEVILENDTFSYNSGYAISVEADTLYIQNSYFSNNDTPVYLKNNLNYINLGDLANADSLDNGNNIWTNNNVFDIVSNVNTIIKAEGNTFDSDTIEGIGQKLKDLNFNGGNGTIDFLTSPEISFVDLGSETYASKSDTVVLAIIQINSFKTDTLKYIKIQNIGTADSSAFNDYTLTVAVDENKNKIFDKFTDSVIGTLSVSGSDSIYEADVDYNFATSNTDSIYLMILANISDVVMDSTYFQAKLLANSINLTIADTGPASDTFTDYKVIFLSNTLYVDNDNGSDFNSGLTSDNALKTISKALSMSDDSGVSIIVLPGTYNEQLNIDTDNISIIGTSVSNTILDINDSGSGNSYIGVLANSSENFTIKNFTIRNYYYGIKFDNMNNSVVDNLKIEYCGKYGVYLWNTSSANTINNCQILNNKSTGIYIHNSNGNTISNNYIYKSFSYGIYLSNASNTVLSNNQSIDNISYGISISASDGCSVNDNSCTSNTDGIYVTNSDNNSFYRNFLEENSGDGIEIYKSNSNTLIQNTFKTNNGYSLRFSGTANNNTANKNDFLTTNNKVVENNVSSDSVNLIRNWWNTVNTATISTKIAGTQPGNVFYKPFRLGIVDTSSALSDINAPTEPIIIKADTQITGRISLEWIGVDRDDQNNFINDLKGYNVFRATVSNPDDWGDTIASLDTYDTGYIDTSVVAGQTYYYVVTAFDSNPVVNESYYSAPTIGLTALEIGDVDNNGVVDFEDFIKIGEQFGLEYNPFDFNENGKVDINDWIYYKQNQK